MVRILIDNNYKEVINYFWIKGYTWSTGDDLYDLGYKSVTKSITVNKDFTMLYNVILTGNEITFSEYKELNPITLEDLDSTMIVETVNGERYLPINDVFTNCYGFNYIKDYKGLNCPGYSEFNIVKIYRIKNFTNLMRIFDSDNLELIWKKEVELTMQEIADKFGIPISQLKIKK